MPGKHRKNIVMPLRAKIVGIGVCVPENIVTNRDLEKIVNTSDQWIRSRTGISERRILKKESSKMASDLGAEACCNALKESGLTPEAVDCIICATFTPDYAFPSTACNIQEKIGAKNATAFDISGACSGFLFGLAIADGFIKSGKYKNVLLVGSEIISRVLDWNDRNTCVLFGDGAGAAVICASEGREGVLSTYTGAGGSRGNILSLPAWGDPRFLKMNGTEVFKHAVRRMKESALRVLETAGLKPENVDWLVTHQANIRIIQATAKQLGIPMEKVIVNVDKYGNTSSASIPLALKDALDRGSIKEGHLVVMAAFGGGLTWGAAAVRW